MRKLVWGALLVALSGGCGGSSGSPSAPTNDSPSAPTPQPYSETITGRLARSDWGEHDLTMWRSGTLTLQLSWTVTVQGTDLDMHLMAAGCGTLTLSTCQEFASTDGNYLVNPEVITHTVFAGEEFRAFIRNWTGPTVNYTLTMTIQ